jgi:hypothetical protein
MAQEDQVAGTLFHNEWDAILLCDCCRDALGSIAAKRSAVVPEIAPVSEARSVYFVSAGDGPIKIGVAANPEARLKELQTGHPYRLEILALVEGGTPLEREYHVRFAAHRLHGEWFARHDDILAEIAYLNQVAECAA